MRPAAEVAAEIAAADHVQVDEVLAIGVAVLAGLDTHQRRSLASVLRTPPHMQAAALASVGRTIVKARRDLAGHMEWSERHERRRRRENLGDGVW